MQSRSRKRRRLQERAQLKHEVMREEKLMQDIEKVVLWLDDWRTADRIAALTGVERSRVVGICGEYMRSGHVTSHIVGDALTNPVVEYKRTSSIRMMIGGFS